MMDPMCFCLEIAAEEDEIHSFLETKQGSKETQAEEAHVNVPAGG